MPVQTQHRILTVLVAAQVLSGVGLAAGVAVGALLAQDMLGSTSLVGLSSAVSTAGAALAAVVVGRISQAHGRRPGLAAGYLTGAVGSFGVVTAAVVDSPVLFLLAMFVYGAGMATNLQARYAGADLASPTRRARAVSAVLVATTLGGMVGPNLAALTGPLGLPHLAGPFVLAGCAYATATVILTVWLRPDPLLLASETTPPQPASEGHGLLFGALVMAVTQLVMVAIMTMTPVHMHNHGHGIAASGFVIAVHIGSMYLPSPLTGWLVDRHGPRAMAAASGLTLLAAGIVAAPANSVVQYTVALALLGLGWNFGLVAGTAIITDAAPLATRAKVQGTVDVSIAIAGAAGGMASGLVVTAASYPFLAISGGILALAVVPAAVATARTR
nr:MFS transporter [Kibdelosporangium aridum]